ncbi:MAG: hypothetical protein HOP18_14900 [Deltaproteobacteria bacterium]|nr:hypothetical protein [Deltaproteobacteria bacterium]
MVEKLVLRDHPFGTKRVPLASGYYEVYNRDNVALMGANAPRKKRTFLLYAGGSPVYRKNVMRWRPRATRGFPCGNAATVCYF